MVTSPIAAFNHFSFHFFPVRTQPFNSHDLAVFTQLASINRQLKLTEQTVQTIASSLKARQETREHKQYRQQWNAVAMTLDRLFFFLFFLAILISLIVLFPKPYSLQFYWSCMAGCTAMNGGGVFIAITRSFKSCP